MITKRCPWAKSDLSIQYHDNEWGRPLHKDNALFEILMLQCMQAGLSWDIVLNKREAMREAFDQFDPVIIAKYTDHKVQQLLSNPNIIRNKLKINALISNAQAFLNIQSEYGDFDSYIWKFVNNETIVNDWTEMCQLPSKTDISQKMSDDLHKHGFKFIGPTVCYAFMQSVGMVNDHMTWCKQYSNCQL